MSNPIFDARSKTRSRMAWAGTAALLVLAACGGKDESLPAAEGGTAPTDTGTAGAGASSTGAGGSGAAGVGGEGGEAGGLNVAQLAVGDPTFQVVGFQMFSAPLGTATDEFMQRKVTVETILPDHELLLDRDLLAPRLPADPPYDLEIAAGVLRAGFVNKDRYITSEWTAPQGIYLAAQIVPTDRSPSGSSADFASGVVLPNSLFPITVDVDLWKGGSLFDDDFDFDFPTSAELQPGTSYDGYSHVPLFFWRNTDMIASSPDTYQFRMRIVDASGNGWRVFVPLFVE
jgi:hypothetical protein